MQSSDHNFVRKWRSSWMREHIDLHLNHYQHPLTSMSTKGHTERERHWQYIFNHHHICCCFSARNWRNPKSGWATYDYYRLIKQSLSFNPNPQTIPRNRQMGEWANSILYGIGLLTVLPSFLNTGFRQGQIDEEVHLSSAFSPALEKRMYERERERERWYIQ